MNINNHDEKCIPTIRLSTCSSNMHMTHNNSPLLGLGSKPSKHATAVGGCAAAMRRQKSGLKGLKGFFLERGWTSFRGVLGGLGFFI